ncbi:hypothetical protein V8C86DRAFT_2643465 [Haematococcus lacustris]
MPTLPPQALPLLPQLQLPSFCPHPQLTPPPPELGPLPLQPHFAPLLVHPPLSLPPPPPSAPLPARVKANVDEAAEALRRQVRHLRLQLTRQRSTSVIMPTSKHATIAKLAVKHVKSPHHMRQLLSTAGLLAAGQGKGGRCNKASAAAGSNTQSQLGQLLHLEEPRKGAGPRGWFDPQHFMRALKMKVDTGLSFNAMPKALHGAFAVMAAGQQLAVSVPSARTYGRGTEAIAHAVTKGQARHPLEFTVGCFRPSSKTALSQAAAIKQCMVAVGLWGLRVLFVVVDSCNANVGIHNSVATHLSNMLQGEGIQDHPVYAIHCLCHILHNTAKHAFESAGQSQLYQRTGYNTALFWVLDHISAELRKDLPEGMPLVEEAVGTRWLSYARIAIYCCQHHAEIVHVLDVRIAATPASAKGTPSHTNLLELQRLLTLAPDVMVQCAALAGLNRCFFQPYLLWGQAGSSRHFCQWHTRHDQELALLHRVCAPPQEGQESAHPACEVFAVAQQLHLTTASAWEVVQPIFLEARRYYCHRMAFLDLMPYRFAQLGDTDSTARQRAAWAVLGHLSCGGMDMFERPPSKELVGDLLVGDKGMGQSG